MILSSQQIQRRRTHRQFVSVLLARLHYIKCVDLLPLATVRYATRRHTRRTGVVSPPDIETPLIEHKPANSIKSVEYIMHRQYTTYIRQDTIITIRLYLATCFGRDRPSSGKLRTTLRYSGITLNLITTVRPEYSLRSFRFTFDHIIMLFKS